MRHPKTPEPATQSQAQLRERRRRRLSVALAGAFQLDDEVRDIAAPLAVRVSAEPLPSGFLAAVHDLAAAVHQCVSGVARLLVEREAYRLTAHLPTDKAAAARALLMQRHTAPTPPPPYRSAQLISGVWPELLAMSAEPFTGALAEYLGAAAAPGTVRGASLSERVTQLLAGVDAAAVTLDRRLDHAASLRAQLRPGRTDTTAAARDAELRRLGVHL